MTKIWYSYGENLFKADAPIKELPELPPGFYQFFPTMSGFYFEKIEFNSQNLLSFEETPNSDVINDIKSFWAKEDLFKKYQFPYKRGILLHGEPGTGKTATVTQVAKEIVNLGGYVIRFQDLDSFLQGMEILRSFYPLAPVVVIMEDLDRLLQKSSVSEFLNMLDGAYKTVENVVYLATTNNPENLHNSIKNRPSRFDRRIEFGPPTASSRRMYLEHLIAVGEKDSQQLSLNLDLDRLVSESDGLSFAHLKELFVSTVCLGRSVSEVISELQLLNSSCLQKDLGLGQYVDGDCGADEPDDPWGETEDY